MVAAAATVSTVMIASCRLRPAWRAVRTLPNKSATEVTYPPQRAGIRLCSADNTEDPSPWPPRPNHVPSEDQIQAPNKAFLGSDIVIVWSIRGSNMRRRVFGG